MEIAEEEEEEQRATKRQSVQDADGTRPQSPADRPSTAEPVTLNSELASSPENSKFAASTTSEVPPFVGVDQRPTSPETDLYTYGSYPYSKQKVKLGPRPSVDANGRPQTPGNFRPVSAIPAGFKMFGKGGKKGKGRDRGNSLSSPQEEIASLNFSVAGNPATDDGLERPVTSSGLSISSLPLPETTPKKPTISREKARLMKAMQLREKKKKLSMQPPLDDGPKESEELKNSVDDDTVQEQDEAISCSELEPEKDKRISLSKDDSGVILETVTPMVTVDQTSDLTPLDSHPTSPLIGSSEADHSTKASSISESTDETVQAKEEDQPSEVDDTHAHTPTENDSKEESVANSGSGGDEIISLADDAENEDTPQEHESVTENLDDAAGGPTTIVADIAVEPEDAPEETAEEQLNERDSLENVALPVSKFSANVSPNPNDNKQHLPTSSTEEPVPEPTDPGVSSRKADDSPALKSKVSAQDLLAAAKAASQPTVVPVPVIPETSLTSTSKTDNLEKLDQSEEYNAKLQQTQDEQVKRKAQVMPIQTTNLQDEGDFEDELQDATLEQATPVTVIQTPVTPSFPSSPLKTQDSHTVRTVSNPVRGNLIVPSDVSQSSARSISSGAAYLHQITQQQQAGNLVKKSNIGSSISQRIKALEKLSASSGDAPAVPTRERPSSTFFAVKKREPSKSPSVLDRANSFRNQTPPSPERTVESSPEANKRNRIERSGSVTSRLSMFESSPGSRSLAVPSGNSTRGRPESVSVTARIIRDPNQAGQMSFEPSRDLSEYNPLELKQSPLLVNHQAASPGKEQPIVEPPTERITETQENGKSGKSRQSSLSIVKGFMKERRRSVTSDAGNPAYSPTRPDTMHTNSAFSPRLSISSHRSSFSRDRDIVISPTDSGSGDDSKSTNGDKKLSRAGRFMRRLSNLSGSRSKNNLSAISTSTTKEEIQEPIQSRPSTTGTPTIVSYMGDVNVQFPDNLLWKRRNMSLDSQGFLILSALPAQNGRPAQGTKRYHLSEFRSPYTPDVEVQELPNSVVLDFIEGSGIQVACEDRAGQLRVLHSKF